MALSVERKFELINRQQINFIVKFIYEMYKQYILWIQNELLYI